MKKRILTLIVAIVSLSIIATGCSKEKDVKSGSAPDYATDEVQSGPLAVQKARGFKVKTLDGKDLTLDQHLGKPIVLNFWASWCPPCQAEAKAFGETERLYRDKGVVFIGMDVRDTKADARAFIKKYDIDYVIGFDPTSQVSNTYQVGPIPVTFFINKEGMIVARWFGEVPEKEMHKNIKEIING